VKRKIYGVTLCVITASHKTKVKIERRDYEICRFLIKTRNICGLYLRHRHLIHTYFCVTVGIRPSIPSKWFNQISHLGHDSP